MAWGYPKAACSDDIDGLSPDALEDLAATKAPFKDGEGIEGRIEVREYDAIYPYAHRVRGVYFEPTAAGKRSLAYRAKRRETA